MYRLVPNFSLKEYNSFGLEVRTDYFLAFTSPDDWRKALAAYPHLLTEKRLVVGEGSNLLFLSDFDGLVISPAIEGLRIAYQDDRVVELEVGAGVVWDELVAHCVEQGWYGVENLSLIPGKVGAAPVQNIGAYGTEVASVIRQVNGINLETAADESYTHDQCRFSYRSSIFKEQLAGRFMVTSVCFRLQKRGVLHYGYGDLEKTVAEMGGPSLQILRQAVIRIRQSKLPDPKTLGNAGSFFKNPVVTAREAEELAARLPGLPVYPAPDGMAKVGAGFLIEQAGWKGRQMGRAAVHDRQALVLVNSGGAEGREILALSQAIQREVLQKFGVTLEREVQVVGE